MAQLFFRQKVNSNISTKTSHTNDFGKKLESWGFKVKKILKLENTKLLV